MHESVARGTRSNVLLVEPTPRDFGTWHPQRVSLDQGTVLTTNAPLLLALENEPAALQLVVALHEIDNTAALDAFKLCIPRIGVTDPHVPSISLTRKAPDV